MNDDLHKGDNTSSRLHYCQNILKFSLHMLLLYFSAWKTLLKWNLVFVFLLLLFGFFSLLWLLIFFFFLLSKIRGTGVNFFFPPLNTFAEWPMKNNNIIFQNTLWQDCVNPSGQFPWPFGRNLSNTTSFGVLKMITVSGAKELHYVRTQIFWWVIGTAENPNSKRLQWRLFSLQFPWQSLMEGVIILHGTPPPPTQTHTPPPEESTQHSTCSDATPLLLPPARENSVQYYFLPCTGSKCKSTLRQRVTPVWPLYHTARGSGLGVKTGPKTTAEPKESQIIDPRKISTSYLKTALMGCRK